MFPPELAELVRNAPKATLRRPAEPYEVIALEDGLTAEAALVMRVRRVSAGTISSNGDFKVNANMIFYQPKKYPHIPAIPASRIT